VIPSNFNKDTLGVFVKIGGVGSGSGMEKRSSSKLANSATLIFFSLFGCLFPMTAQNNNKPVPRTLFGMHINNLALPDSSTDLGKDPAPPANVPYAGLRLHDAGVTWAILEPSRGVFDWSRLDDYVQFAQQRNLDLVLTVEDTPQWASSQPNLTNCAYSQFGSGGCAMPQNIQDYVDFLSALVARYKGHIQFYEGWNEANHGWNAPNAQPATNKSYFVGTDRDLLLLQQKLYQTVKAIDPSAQVISPSFVNGQQGVTDANTFLADGACSYFDIHGFHYYVRGAPPEAIPPLVSQMQQTLALRSCSKPMWDTESGWNAPNPFPSLSAPGFVARAYLLAWAAGLQRFYWYAYNNRTFDTIFLNDPNNLDRISGPGYAFANVQSWLINQKVTGCSPDFNNIYACALNDTNGNPSWIVWYAGFDTPSGNNTVEYNVPASWTVSSAVDINGNKISPGPTILVGPNPILLSSQPPASSNKPQHVSSASYNGTVLAPASLASAFGSDLATTTKQASSLGTNLGGTTVQIKDSSGSTGSALIYYVSPGQVNYILPDSVAIGPATITVTNGNGATSSSTVWIAPVAPAIFGVSSNLQGAPAAVVLHVAPDGKQTFSDAFQCNPACVPLPIDLGPSGSRVVLEIYGTGIRNSSSQVLVQVGGRSYGVQFAGNQGQYAGLDQVNVRLPPDLAGTGPVALTVIVDGQVSNTLQMNIK
jgi:uncharacterized protein (TIGR03437 family)